MLLKGVDETTWKESIQQNNILQVKNPATAIRIGRLVRKRLELMTPELWRLVRDETGTVSTHAVFAAAIKHSQLLGDFLDLVVREQYRIFNTVLSDKLWKTYLDDCRGRDPVMPVWNESTRKRLRSSVYQILAQAGYIENTRTKKLQTVHIASKVLQYLEKNKENYVLHCIRVPS